MTARPAVAQAAKMSRLLYGALISGVLLFALVAHFILRPSFAEQGVVLPPAAVQLLVGISLACCAASVLFRRRVPKRRMDESAELFWPRALPLALVVWAILEGALLSAIVLYALTGSPSAIGVWAIALVLFLMLNPRRLERG